jgi:uncharacterized membrane protein (UPF0127 family)
MASKFKTVWIYVSLVPIAMAGSFWLSQNMRSNNSVAEENPSVNPTEAPQSIPVEVTVQLGNETFDVEIAKDGIQRRDHVQWRTLEDFPENRAMLVVNPKTGFLDPFYSKNLKFPVELIVVAEKKVYSLSEVVEACEGIGCPKIEFQRTAFFSPNAYFIVRAGTIDRAGIKIGQDIKLINK